MKYSSLIFILASLALLLIAAGVAVQPILTASSLSFSVGGFSMDVEDGVMTVEPRITLMNRGPLP